MRCPGAPPNSSSWLLFSGIRARGFEERSFPEAPNERSCFGDNGVTKPHSLSGTQLVWEEGSSTRVWAKIEASCLHPLKQGSLCPLCTPSAAESSVPWLSTGHPSLPLSAGTEVGRVTSGSKRWGLFTPATRRFSDPLGNLWTQTNPAPGNPVAPSPLHLPFFPQKRPDLATRPAPLAVETEGTQCILLGCRT